MSNGSIISIKDMIDLAFGDPEENNVNFKLIQTVLYILARQLRLLERKVGVDISPNSIRLTSSISITEVKLLANVAKKKKHLTKSVKESSRTKEGMPLYDQSEPASSKSTTDKSSEKTTSKSTTERTSSSGPTSSSVKTKSTSDKSSSDREKKEYKKKDYHHLLEGIEEQRERELRVVNQRADSREEAENPPTPMASLDSMELQFEKLLIVERVPTERGRSRDTTEISLVTKEQFQDLIEKVKELQNKFGLAGLPGFPENMQLMQDLRKGASLTDAMAALQLSARLDAAEKTLQQMMSLVTDLAIKTGIDLTPVPEKESEIGETKVIFDVNAQSDVSHVKQKSPARKQSPKAGKKLLQPTSTDTIRAPTSTETSRVDQLETQSAAALIKTKKDWININELDEAMQQIYDSLIKTVTNITNKTASNAESALKLALKLEEKLGTTVDLNSRMTNLELSVSEYADQINTLDTGLSSQMTNYQEQLTQMQHDLEVGLESMAEALANTGGDTVAVAELNQNFTNLQIDFDGTNIKQKELKENQEILSVDLQSLWKQIELLRGAKSDREEVADALRDKAGLGALNGLVTQQQFDAVRGDLEKRIGASYDKFNNQEIIWQKAIDDLLRELNEKADLAQVTSLRDDINENLEKLRRKINALLEIIGEPRSAAVSKKLFRDTACLSCSSPAHMDIEEPNLIRSLPAAPNHHLNSSNTEYTNKPKEDGDNDLCFPGRPIPPTRKLGPEYCRRYCGGSHTTVKPNENTRPTMKRAPTEIIIKSAVRQTAITGSVGKVYELEDSPNDVKPCYPCNFVETVTTKPFANGQKSSDDSDTPLNFMPQADYMTTSLGSITPPLNSDDD